MNTVRKITSSTQLKPKSGPQTAGIFVDATGADPVLQHDADGTVRTVVDTVSKQSLLNKTLLGPVAKSAQVTPAIALINDDGAITPESSLVHILKAGAPALLTVAAAHAPDTDGVTITVVSLTAQAHVITFTGATLYDGSAAAFTTATFAAKAGANITFQAMGDNWVVLASNNVTLGA